MKISMNDNDDNIYFVIWISHPVFASFTVPDFPLHFLFVFSIKMISLL